MKNLILIFTITLFLACTKEDKKGNNSFALYQSFYINLRDGQGNNLINTTNYLSANFKVFYVNNGVATEYYQPQYDNPKAYRIVEVDGNPTMLLTLNNNDEEFPLTYVKWNETDTDTIKANFKRGNGFDLLDKVWVNDGWIQLINANTYLLFNICKYTSFGLKN